MKTLKLIFAVLTLPILFSSCLKEKIYHENDIVQQYTALDKLFSEYTVVEIDTDRILNYSKEKHNEEFVLDLKIQNKPNWVFNVNFYEFFKPDYKVFESNANDDWVEVIRTDRSDAYHGQSVDLKSKSMFIMEEHLFTGNIYEGDTEYFIEPLNRFVNNSSPNLYVYYPINADISGEHATCGNTDEDFLNIEEREPVSTLEYRAGCREMSITYTADYQLREKFGNNTSSTRNFVENRIRYASYRYWGYNKFPLHLRLYRGYIRTTKGNPPTTSTNPSTSLGQWKTYAKKHLPTADGNLLFTGRNVGVSGNAYPRTVCRFSGGARLAFAQIHRWTGASNAFLSKVTAHEIGHLLGALHSTTGFMIPGGYTYTNMAKVSRSEMSSYISRNNSCMPNVTCAWYK